MKIVLFKEMIFKTGLTYEQACKALKAACETPAEKYIAFSIQSKSEGKWSLVGSPRLIRRRFINSPENFVIEID